MLRNHQAIGFRQSVNNRTQKESPCRIPCFSCIGPILSFFSLILTSSVMDHFFIENEGVVSKETVVLRRWGSSIQNLVLSTELIM